MSYKGFVVVHPMERKSQFESALNQFCKDVGVPYTLVVDPSGERTKKPVHYFCHTVVTTLKIIEEYTQ